MRGSDSAHPRQPDRRPGQSVVPLCAHRCQQEVPELVRPRFAAAVLSLCSVGGNAWILVAVGGLRPGHRLQVGLGGCLPRRITTLGASASALAAVGAAVLLITRQYRRYADT